MCVQILLTAENADLAEEIFFCCRIRSFIFFIPNPVIRVYLRPEYSVQTGPRCISSSISRTARSIPTSTARAIMLWPMLNSFIPEMDTSREILV